MIYTDTIHVVADTVDELHEFAEKIGMPRNYYEGVRKGHPHYDLRRGMTKEDIRKGGRIYLALAAGAQFRNKKAILQLSWKMLENEETQKQVEKEKTFFFQDWKKIWVNPPVQCNGACDIREGMTSSVCRSCKWSDE